MDYFQGVVESFLKSDRAMFVHGEMLIDLDATEESPNGMALKGRHWYCDVAALNMRDQTLYLGEVTYARTLAALTKRLSAWAAVWPDLRAALGRAAAIPDSWSVVPWAFIPKASHELLARRLASNDAIGRGGLAMPVPRITYLEDIVPWRYGDWKNRPDSLDRGFA